MADGTRTDWRPDEPSRQDLAGIESDVETLLAESSDLLAEYAAEHRQTISASERKLRRTIRPSRRRALRHAIDESWDAIGHLGMGA